MLPRRCWWGDWCISGLCDSGLALDFACGDDCVFSLTAIFGMHSADGDADAVYVLLIVTLFMFISFFDELLINESASPAELLGEKVSGLSDVGSPFFV
mgnify:CR=1 FL=1